MKLLAELIDLTEAKWSADVKTKKHPPPSLFSHGSSGEIVDWLAKEHKDLKSAMSSLDFYINRAGSKLGERKGTLEGVKRGLRKKFEKADDQKDDDKE